MERAGTRVSGWSAEVQYSMPVCMYHTGLGLSLVGDMCVHGAVERSEELSTGYGRSSNYSTL